MAHGIRTGTVHVEQRDRDRSTEYLGEVGVGPKVPGDVEAHGVEMGHELVVAGVPRSLGEIVVVLPPTPGACPRPPCP
ncbi:hypothetical protein KEF29_37380 [Streptomyces tuirus]|uniref:Uncharacterized protein n=1 Tax=Streptomyces tuirus TaxID=68278 RepID=A0A941J601_9ACTN|nr:hypothetical protein [Streptomyces tuirus]